MITRSYRYKALILILIFVRLKLLLINFLIKKLIKFSLKSRSTVVSGVNWEVCFKCREWFPGDLLG